MDRNGPGLAALETAIDRFADWPRPLARLALVLLAVLLVLAAVAPGYAPPPPAPPKVTVADVRGAPATTAEDDNDFRLYRHVVARVAAGENYYHAAVSEQRAHHYPVAPGLTVRLPTLAVVAAAVGERGLMVLQLALFATLILAARARLVVEPGGSALRLTGPALLLAGTFSGLSYHYLLLHEIWAGELVALSFFLHRPDRGQWRLAWLAAALALALRELALPCVLLQAAWAGWHRRPREAAAWAGLAILFAAGLAVHLHWAQAPALPGDAVSPSWLVLGGLAGFLYKVINSSILATLPVALAGPLVILALFGWSSWRSAMGGFGFLLTAGYALGFMLFGRDNNFYWGVMLTPILFVGAGLAPRGLLALCRRAGPERTVHRAAHA